MSLRTVRLEPVNSEKDRLLHIYMAEWRRAYAMSAAIARRIDMNARKQAALWYRAHQFRCDHEPRCKTFEDYWYTFRNPRLAGARKKVAAKRTIHSVAWSQAWYKGFSNRKWSPTAFKQMALIPKMLVSRGDGLLLLRLYPNLELAFEIPKFDVADDQAIRLVYRYSDRGRIPKGWSLRV